MEEMLAEVEGERGALPLLAFAAARLWEKRDRENGLLTRQAYHDIGGVGGALARHAEETIDRIGSRAGADRAGAVPQPCHRRGHARGARVGRAAVGVRAIRNADHAEEVLRELIDARLLTSYEVQEEDREPTRRVEIIHESLLANWPRLVRWQTQDAGRCPAPRPAPPGGEDVGRTGPQRRPLWTGSAYRDFASGESVPGWPDRDRGGLRRGHDLARHPPPTPTPIVAAAWSWSSPPS